ncbi:MAG: hypothetical protein WKF83_16925 [Nocardioidaceae bacterium]
MSALFPIPDLPVVDPVGDSWTSGSTGFPGAHGSSLRPSSPA